MSGLVPIVSKSLLAGVFACLIASPSAQGAASAYYQIDFEGPGSIPTGNLESLVSNAHAFSRISFGNIGIGQFPGTGSNAAVFNTTGNSGPGFFYDQAQMRFDQVGRFHQLSMDLYFSGLLGTKNHFSIFFDNPSSYVLEFRPDGTLRNLSAGYFQEDKPFHIDIVADAYEQVLNIAIDGIPLPSLSYSSDELSLRSIRFSLGSSHFGDPNDGSTTVYVDNIIATVPEPSLFLLGLPHMALLFVRRRPDRSAE